mmetsp:Transcript_26993/g.81709  ORF Transcript_26993/g.81709 Transcript_26993/m.81709 type:complete len:95 (-) Transcript_26993:135-419(-)
MVACSVDWSPWLWPALLACCLQTLPVVSPCYFSLACVKASPSRCISPVLESVVAGAVPVGASSSNRRALREPQAQLAYLEARRTGLCQGCDCAC